MWPLEGFEVHPGETEELGLCVCEWVMGYVHMYTSQLHKFPYSMFPYSMFPPDAHYAVRAATLRLVAVLAEWIDSHPDTLGEYIHHVLCDDIYI